MMSNHCLFYKLIWLFYEMWFGIWFSWFGKNAKTCWDGPDKMTTKKLWRTKCQPQKKVRTKCQPLVGIMSGWHFVWLAFCPTTDQMRWSDYRILNREHPAQGDGLCAEEVALCSPLLLCSWESVLRESQVFRYEVLSRRYLCVTKNLGVLAMCWGVLKYSGMTAIC